MGKRQEVNEERWGKKDVLGAFQVPVLSLAASQGDEKDMLQIKQSILRRAYFLTH